VLLRPDELPTPRVYTLQSTQPDGGSDRCLYSIQQPRPWGARWFVAVRRHRDADAHATHAREVIENKSRIVTLGWEVAVCGSMGLRRIMMRRGRARHARARGD
jgi:hypothetical protein